MPLSRNRKNRKNPNIKHTHKDIRNINEAFKRKLGEFEELSLEELKQLQASKTQKGTYAIALTSAINNLQMVAVMSPASGDVVEEEAA